MKRLRHEKNTKKKYILGGKVFRDWLVERPLDLDFEVLTPEDLNKILGQFYVEARRQDGSLYLKCSLNGMRSAIQRHLQSELWNWPHAIIHNPVFSPGDGKGGLHFLNTAVFLAK